MRYDHWIVAPVVAGPIPVTHPSEIAKEKRRCVQSEQVRGGVMRASDDDTRGTKSVQT